MAACRLACKGKTMADSSYDSEVSSILSFLSMQHPSPTPVINPNQADIQPEYFVAPRFQKKFKAKQVRLLIFLLHVLNPLASRFAFKTGGEQERCKGREILSFQCLWDSRYRFIIWATYLFLYFCIIVFNNFTFSLKILIISNLVLNATLISIFEK